MISEVKLVVLISSVCGILNFYQTGENNNITIKLDSQNRTDLSLTNLVCVLQSKTIKVLYEMINGNEHTESQHQQFAGRVQLDKDALREGRIRLHLSTVTSEDSGKYWCDLAAAYDKLTRRWGLQATEHFIIKVNPLSGGENSDVSIHTPGRGTAAGVKHPARLKPREGRDIISARVGPGLAGAALAVLIVYMLYLFTPVRFLANMCMSASTT